MEASMQPGASASAPRETSARRFRGRSRCRHHQRTPLLGLDWHRGRNRPCPDVRQVLGRSEVTRRGEALQQVLPDDVQQPIAAGRPRTLPIPLRCSFIRAAPIAVSHSLADGGTALGAQAGPGRMLDTFRDAGLPTARVAATTASNLLLVATI